MPAISVTFDEADSESVWADLEKAYQEGKVIETTGLRCLMTPGAMTSGAPALSFRFDLVKKDGTPAEHVIARISLGNLLSQLVPAIRGRLAFLGIDENGAPLAKPDGSAN